MELFAKDRLAQSDLWAMFNVKAERTGLPNGIGVLISEKAGAKSGPRIKVSNLRGKFPAEETAYFSVSVSDAPAVISGTPKDFSSLELTAIYSWIKLNEKALLKFWNSGTMELLKKLPSKGS